MKKEVKLDKDGWLTEIDAKALRREALDLRAYIMNAPEEEEETFWYRGRLLPFVERALAGQVVLPFKGPAPYFLPAQFEGREPMMPSHAMTLYSRFMNRIRGSPSASATSRTENGLYKPNWREVHGERYEEVEFED